jgi:acyl-CoA dehydrogenase
MGHGAVVRDARIAMIYEGANGIQALDLVGRKLPANGGRAVMAFFKEVGTFCEENRDNEDLAASTPRAAEERSQRPAGRDHVVHEQRDGEAGQCRRRLDRLHAPLRPRHSALGYMWALMAKVLTP